MKHLLLSRSFSFAAILWMGCGLAAFADEPRAEVAAIQVPEGFEAQLIAAPPLVEYPMLACFDDRGRLYVSEGANINDPYEVLAKTLPRSIRRLEDTNGDGVFDRSTVFADKMTFPYGGVWHDNALYVASDPSLWRLEDTDGDGVADKRDVVVTGFQSVGHAACMKGGFLGRDGWMYFTGGSDGPYHLIGRDGNNVQDSHAAPGVFRIRPDGTGLEYFANGAMGVYELCFEPGGDMFGVVTILKYPRGDGLMHWVYGGIYECTHPASSNLRSTGPKLPALHEWPQTSPSGTMRYESGAFGDEYQGNLFTAHFNTHVVTRSVVERDGGTWRYVREEPFVQSSTTNCRFTDVLEDADGSLVVVNTGGWFRIGCPTSQVGEGDLRGAIYRIRKTGAKSPADPRGLNIDWTRTANGELVKLFGDARTAVRDRAIAECASRGAACVPDLHSAMQSPSVEMRRSAVWAATRIDSVDARAVVRGALADSEPTNVMAALHAVGLWRDAKASDRLIKLLTSDDLAVRRETACALGRIGNAAAVPALFETIANISDRFVEHAAILAILEINSQPGMLAGLKNASPRTQRAALIILDQMTPHALTQDNVRPLLRSNDYALQNAALDVIGRHKDWSTTGVAETLASWLQNDELSVDRANTLYGALLKFSRDPDVLHLVAATMSRPGTSSSKKLLLLQMLARSRPRKQLADLREAVDACLHSDDAVLVRQAIVTTTAIRGRRFEAQLNELALDPKRPTTLRIFAASTIIEQGWPLDDRLLDLLISQCASGNSDAVVALTVSRALGNLQATPAQLDRLTRAVAVAGALELPAIICAFEDSAEPADGEKLCAALLESPGTSSLSAARVQRLLARYPQSVQVIAEPLLQRLRSDLKTQTTRMKELEFARDGGDRARGHDLFFGKAACSQCHRVRREGANIGPDLSHIGDTRSRRELIEAVAFPSATLARGFEPVLIITSDGVPIAGTVRRESATDLHILTADRSETVVPLENIDDIIPNNISIMPQGLDRNLTPDELRDLIAYLFSLRSD